MSLPKNLFTEASVINGSLMCLFRLNKNLSTIYLVTLLTTSTNSSDLAVFFFFFLTHSSDPTELTHCNLILITVIHLCTISICVMCSYIITEL